MEKWQGFLADLASGDLEPRDQIELEAHLSAHPEQFHQDYELAAAIYEQALTVEQPQESLPEELKQLLLADAGLFFGVLADSEPPNNVQALPSKPQPGKAPSRLWMALALAAMLFAGVLGWLLLASQGVLSNPSEDRARLLRTAEAVKIPWTTTEDPAATGATGDVVWSPAEQAGFLRIQGLQSNSSGEFQYQLWIFDKTRDERYPVDGGLFDMPAGSGEVLIPIQARLKISEAALFAVTVEKPGGVVVSDRSRIVLVASPSA